MKTIFLTGLEASNLFGSKHEILPYTTLNQLYAVDSPYTEDNPTLQYFGIGIKKLDIVRIGETLTNLNPNKRGPLSTNVRFPIPFVAVPVTSDLTLSERAEYRMRAVKIINDEAYALYYLKKSDLSIVGNYLSVKLNDDGTSIPSKLQTTMSTGVLSEEPVNDHVISVDRSDKDFVAYSKYVKCNLSPLDVKNIREAITLIYPNNTLIDEKFIGEICLFSGVEVPVDNYTEASLVQAGMFVEVNLELESLIERGTTEIFELGGMELTNGEGL